jgi:hypothetical protein
MGEMKRKREKEKDITVMKRNTMTFRNLPCQYVSPSPPLSPLPTYQSTISVTSSFSLLSS